METALKLACRVVYTITIPYLCTGLLVFVICAQQARLSRAHYRYSDFRSLPRGDLEFFEVFVQ